MKEIKLLGIPWDADSSYLQGPALGPAAIREELEKVRVYSNMTTELGVDLDAPGLWSDAGDVPVSNSDDTRKAITAKVAQLMREGHPVLSLGGDHSVTFPILCAVHANLGKVDVLHFDAHPDLYDEFEGSRFSHACPFARSLEDGLIGRIVQVGIRTLNQTQRRQVERFGVEQVPMSRWDGPPTVKFDRPVYVSLDIDALDPAFAPGVSHREPGGLSVRDILATLHRLQGRVVAADLVELNPRTDINGVTATVAVKLLRELAGLLARR
jgi:agmatinase